MQSQLATRAINLIIEGEIPTTHIVRRLLEEAVGNDATVRQMYAHHFTPEALGRDAIPLLVRIGDPSIGPMLAWMVRNRIPYLYYIDDNFWALEGDTPLAQYYQAPEVRATLKLAVSNAHAVIVNSPLLGEYIREKFGARVRVLHAPFDFSLLDDAAPCESGETVRIGFAGSVSREGDFSVVTPAIERILKDFAGVEFFFFGYCPPALRGHERVRFVPHVDNYEAFIALKQRTCLDIGLAPIAAVESNLYKTNNKYREYGAMRIAGIYTDSPPYRGSVEPGVTGLLVPQSEEGWYAGMARLVGDTTLRTAIAEAAYQDVRQHYAQSVVAKQWRTVLAEYGATARFPELGANALQVAARKIRTRAQVARTLLRIRMKLVRMRSACRQALRARNLGDGR